MLRKISLMTITSLMISVCMGFGKKQNKLYQNINDIDSSDLVTRDTDGGRIEEIEYDTKDYFGNESKIEKKAFVYLPKGYDTAKKYNVLYLMHGIGGNEKEWGLCEKTSKVKAIMDNLIIEKKIEPFIVVAANGRSSVNYADTNSDFHSFYCFGKELRNDLIPYIDKNYATYATYSEKGYDLTNAREHRAMAGLSMGGMQTINIGMCECLDIISYFGSFSSAPTTNNAEKIAECLNKFDNIYNINYLYMICGTEDTIAYNWALSAATGLTSLTNRLQDEKNFLWQEVKGVHDFDVWYLGYYNFANIVFK